MACPFCAYAGPSPVLWEREGCFAIEPLNPVTKGHILVIPLRHVEDALANPFLTGSVFTVAAWYARSQSEDVNLITSVGPSATQTIRHLHVHVVPRRYGDGLALPWTGSD